MWAKLIGSVASYMMNHYANSQAEKSAERSRQQNFAFGEMAANAADKRFRKQYLDFFSPKAQLKQLKDAGLSPSVMYQGGAGAGGATAPQGGGAGGLQAPYYPTTALEAAQIGLIQAQTNNVNEDTIATEIQNGINKLKATTYANQWNLINSTFFGDENGVLSWNDLAQNCKDYNEFQTKVTEILKNSAPEMEIYVKSEEGQKTLRNMYEDYKKFDNEISVLAYSKANTDLMLKITNLLNNQNFAELSADAQLKQLSQIIESEELTTLQKGAMNRLINKMGKSTTTDIMLVLMMILGQYSHVNFSFGASHNK